jgi:hypothetical protein
LARAHPFDGKFRPVPRPSSGSACTLCGNHATPHVGGRRAAAATAALAWDTVMASVWLSGAAQAVGFPEVDMGGGRSSGLGDDLTNQIPPATSAAFGTRFEPKAGHDRSHAAIAES